MEEEWHEGVRSANHRLRLADLKPVSRYPSLLPWIIPATDHYAMRLIARPRPRHAAVPQCYTPIRSPRANTAHDRPHKPPDYVTAPEPRLSPRPGAVAPDRQPSLPRVFRAGTNPPTPPPRPERNPSRPRFSLAPLENKTNPSVRNNRSRNDLHTSFGPSSALSDLRRSRRHQTNPTRRKSWCAKFRRPPDPPRNEPGALLRRRHEKNP